MNHDDYTRAKTTKEGQQEGIKPMKDMEGSGGGEGGGEGGEGGLPIKQKKKRRGANEEEKEKRQRFIYRLGYAAGRVLPCTVLPTQRSAVLFAAGPISLWIKSGPRATACTLTPPRGPVGRGSAW